MGGHWLLLGLLVAVGAALLAYVVWRVATDRPLTGAEVFGAYLRIATFVGVVLIVFGGGELLKVGFAQTVGDGFTYGARAHWSGYSPAHCGTGQGSGPLRAVPRLEANPAVPSQQSPLPFYPGQQTPAPVFPGQQLPAPAFPGQPQPAPQATAVPGADHFGPVVNPCLFSRPPPPNLTTGKQSDAIQGGVVLLLGLALVVLHRLLRRRFFVDVDAHGSGRWTESLVGLAFFGLIALLALLVAVPGSLEWLFGVAGAADRHAPGESLAFGLTALAAWVYYLRVAVMDSGRRAAPAPPMEEPPSDTSP